jgi:hypothetical protein
MLPEASLSCSEEASIGPYPEPDESSPNSLRIFLIHLNIYYESTRSRVGRPLRIRELTVLEGYNLEEGVPEHHPLILMHQVAVNFSVRSVTARIT